MPNVFGHNQLEMMEEEEWDGPGAGETPQDWLSPSFTNLRTPIPPGTPNLLQNTIPEAAEPSLEIPMEDSHWNLQGGTHFKLHFPLPF